MVLLAMAQEIKLSGFFRDSYPYLPPYVKALLYSVRKYGLAVLAGPIVMIATHKVAKQS